jgi:hypothetical protein
MRVKPVARTSLWSERFIEFVVREVFLFIKQTFPSPELINSAMAGLNGGKKLSGEPLSPRSRPRRIGLLKAPPSWQEQNHPRAAIRSACARGKKCFFCRHAPACLAGALRRPVARSEIFQVPNAPLVRGYIIQPFLRTHNVPLSIVAAPKERKGWTLLTRRVKGVC